MAAKQKREKVLPGISGDTEESKARASRKLCSLVLRGKKADLPTGSSKSTVRQWCEKNRVGSKFSEDLPREVREACEAKEITSKARCRDALTEGRKAAETFTMDPRKVISKGAPLVEKTLKGKTLEPYQKTALKKPCKAPARKDTEGNAKPLRSCHVELEFLNQAQAEKAGLRTGAGPYIRVCGDKAKQSGALYRVSSPQQAQELIRNACKQPAPERISRIKAGQGPKPDGFGAADHVVSTKYGIGEGIRLVEGRRGLGAWKPRRK